VPVGLATSIFRGGRPILGVCAKTILHKNAFLENLQAVILEPLRLFRRQLIAESEIDGTGHQMPRRQADSINRSTTLLLKESRGAIR